MIQPNQFTRRELLTRLQELIEEEKRIVDQLSKIDEAPDSEIATFEGRVAQREQQIASLRGSVKRYGDIVSPIDVEWDACQ